MQTFLRFASLLPGALAKAQGAMEGEATLIEFIGPWTDALLIPGTEHHQKTVIAASRVTNRIGAVTKDTGDILWIQDLTATSSSWAKYSTSGNAAISLHGARVDEAGVHLSMNDVLGAEATIHLNFNGRLENISLGESFQTSPSTNVLSDVGIKASHGGIVLTGDSWTRDESLGSVISATPILTPTTNYRDQPDHALQCTDGESIAPYLLDTVMYGNSANARDQNLANDARVAQLLTVSRFGTVHVSTPAENALKLERAYQLDVQDRCSNGLIIPGDDTASLWRLSKHSFAFVYRCEDSSSAIHAVELTLKDDGNLVQKPLMSYPFDSGVSIESTGQSLIIVDRSQMEESTQGRTACTRLIEHSEWMRHVLHAGDHEGPEILKVVTQNQEKEDVVVRGYECVGHSDGTLRSEPLWQSRFQNVNLVQKIENREVKTALAMGLPGGNYRYQPTSVTGEGDTLFKYPTEVLSMYLVHDQDKQMTLKAVNALTGEVTAAYNLSDMSQPDADFNVLRTSSQVLIHYRGPRPDFLRSDATNNHETLWYLESLDFLSDIEHDPWYLLKSSFGLASSKNAPIAQELTPPLITARTYILPSKVSQWMVTQSELGITPRSLLMTLEGNGFYSLPSMAVSSRRPILSPGAKPEPGEVEEGIHPYDPHPMKLSTLHHLRPFAERSVDLDGTKTFSTFISYPMLSRESGSHIMLAGKGILAVALIHPAGKFDTLPSDEDYTEKLIAIVVLIAAIIASKVYKRMSASRKNWE